MNSTAVSQPAPNGTYFTRSPAATPTPPNVRLFGLSQMAVLPSPAAEVTLCSSTTDNVKAG